MVKQLIIDEHINLKSQLRQIEKLKSSGIIVNEYSNKDCFSIYIGFNEIECEKYSLAYLLNKELSYYSNNITSVFGDEALDIALCNVVNDFKNIDKKVLLYLGKFPEFGFDVDGGSILARQLIDSLKIRCKLDLVFIRKNKEEYQDELVNSISYVEYKDAFNNKFVRRLENLDTNIEALKDYERYDKIITAHVSKFFGIEKGQKEFWNKTILFPMFCTSSYKRAGEYVPAEYTQLENLVINSVSKIITPSEQEREDLINDYQCDITKVQVIPRGINPLFHFTKKIQFDDRLRIVYIGSIKPQKNNIEALFLLKELKGLGVPAEMHFICTIQDKNVYSKMMQFIDENNFHNDVYFHFEMSQKDMPDLLSKMDINISVSNWETFGRGIFEGISSGLPTFVLEHLAVVKEICRDNIGICYSKSYKDMAIAIRDLFGNFDRYLQKREALKSIARVVSYKNEQNRLLETILNNE